MSTTSEINISLEPHLAETLSPLLPILPAPLAAQLDPLLEYAQRASTKLESGSSNPAIPVIPYSTLSAIAAWARSPEGRAALHGCSLSLDPGDYTMIALLAGTRTSPERKFPPGRIPSQTTDADHRRELNDRRAVTAVINALLSILGSGVATWWAADVLHWREEWKALLALAVAGVVAISEGVLFLIWDSRRSKKSGATHVTAFTNGHSPSTAVGKERAIASPDNQDQDKHTASASGDHLDAATSTIQPHYTEGLRARVRRQKPL